MEPDMAVNMLHNLKDKGFHVKKLVLYNDATTILKAIMNALLKSCTSVHVPSLMNETDHGIVKKRIITS